MRAEVIEVEYLELNDPLQSVVFNKSENALRVRLSGGNVLFVRLGLFARLEPEVVRSMTPRWGRNLKLRVIREVEISQQIIGYLISMAKLNDETTRRCFELLK